MRYVFLFLPFISLTVCALIIRYEVKLASKRGSVLSPREFGQVIVALLLGGVAIIFVLFIILKPHLL